ncbi:MAG: hypothetical protein NZ700_13435 [Gemmataceae bacterium]|nr:hypothetical protein [Gemmataceae bacterium]MDW8266420.1 hypothetical protein [Gemmataceae bacterium]
MSVSAAAPAGQRPSAWRACQERDSMGQLRTTLGVTLLAAFILFSATKVLLRSAAFGPRHFFSVPLEAIQHYEHERFAGLRLPAGEVIGYIDNFAGQPPDPGSFYLTQYVLAPRILVAGSSCRWVLGNFRDPAVQPPEELRHRFALVQDLGNGVKCYRVEEP